MTNYGKYIGITMFNRETDPVICKLMLMICVYVFRHFGNNP